MEPNTSQQIALSTNGSIQETESGPQAQQSIQNCTAQVPLLGSRVELLPRSDRDDGEKFKDHINQYQLELENGFRQYEVSLSQRNRDEELANMDWDDLEKRCNQEMRLHIAAEQDIMDEFQARFKQFMLWMQVSNEKEAERAIKRLRTRVAYVQNSEEQYANKQEHYTKVLSAFQTAMALLNNQ